MKQFLSFLSWSCDSKKTWSQKKVIVWIEFCRKRTCMNRYTRSALEYNQRLWTERYRDSIRRCLESHNTIDFGFTAWEAFWKSNFMFWLSHHRSCRFLVPQSQQRYFPYLTCAACPDSSTLISILVTNIRCLTKQFHTKLKIIS